MWTAAVAFGQRVAMLDPRRPVPTVPLHLLTPGQGMGLRRAATARDRSERIGDLRHREVLVPGRRSYAQRVRVDMLGADPQQVDADARLHLFRTDRADVCRYAVLGEWSAWRHRIGGLLETVPEAGLPDPASRLPATLSECRAGQITADAPQVILGATAVVADQPDVAASVEQAVLPHTRWLTREGRRRRVVREVIRSDPDGADRRHTAAKKQRCVSKWSDVDGMGWLKLHADGTSSPAAAPAILNVQDDGRGGIVPIRLQAADAVVPFDDALPAISIGGDGSAPGASGARQEDEQGQQNDQDTAAHQDVTDGGEIELAHIGFDAERQYRSGDDQEDA